ncbi:uncharacterized protein LOC110022576 [Phalaenopsis equestris]|uniref:uncharacterized protein LOC110022576 n=1 Tax=Phalaenopsis equestris TaxID=78828 RepID=UPI0009E54CDD|nr:uncharacterized protein LOC110022576 [Phalaenopsis equestris]
MEDGEGSKEGAGEHEVNPHDTAKPSISPPSAALPHLVVPTRPSPIAKKGTDRRKKISLSAKQRKLAEGRLVLLNKNFRPIPFSPAKTLDFSAHEQLFRELGLWDFAHLQFDEEVRPDLLADLIAYYDSSNHRSYVRNTRISVTRVHLARAVGLPTKKEKRDAFDGRDRVQELVSVDGATKALLDFISSYMLFDEMCILPEEIIQATKLVKEGVPYKVDWAAIMWVLVEKELSEGHESGTFCYASHLQQLIKHQRPQLFLKEPEPVFAVAEPEEVEDISVADEAVNMAEDDVNAAEVHLTEEEGDADIRKMRSLQDMMNVASEGHDCEFGLTLGDDVMDDFDDCKMNAESEWLEGEKNEGFKQCLRRCNSKASENLEFENLAEMGEEKNIQERSTAAVSVKVSNFERLNSSDLMQELSNVGIPYAAQVNTLNPSYKNIIMDSGLGGSNCFGYSERRQIDEIGDEERDQFDHKCRQKRLRAYEPWGNLPFSFDDCMNMIQVGAKKAKALYSEKYQELSKMEDHIQYLNHLVHEKELAIRSLKELEEQRNWQMDVQQYERELCLVTQLMLGYKTALKETRGRFADYRKQHPCDVDPLYKDVPGTGGLVLSAREFEKVQLVKEEEKRQQLLCAFRNLEQILSKFEKCEERVTLHDVKLGKLVGEMRNLKDGFVKSGCLDV